MTNETQIRELSPQEINSVSGGNAFIGAIVGWAVGKVLDHVVETATGEGWLPKVVRQVEKSKK